MGNDASQAPRQTFSIWFRQASINELEEFAGMLPGIASQRPLRQLRGWLGAAEKQLAVERGPDEEPSVSYSGSPEEERTRLMDRIRATLWREIELRAYKSKQQAATVSPIVLRGIAWRRYTAASPTAQQKLSEAPAEGLRERLILLEDQFRQLHRGHHNEWRLRGTEVGNPSPVLQEMYRLDSQIDDIKAELVRRGEPLHHEAPIAEGKPAGPVFSHSPDYRTVTLRGKSFSLTRQQAQVIEILHEVHKSGNPEVSGELIFERLGRPSTAARLRDSFKSNPRAWNALIRSGKTKGSYRLNL